MKGRRLLPAAALAALLAGGCDYLDNLFEEKRLDKASLTLRVEDAWLGHGLKGTECDAPGFPALPADEEGYIRWQEVPTGEYTITCTSPGYYPRRLPVYLGAGKSQADTLGLARRGDDWYPGNPFAQPKIIFMGPTSHFPGKVKFTAYPFDTARPEIFQYEWSTSQGRPDLIKQGANLTAVLDSFPEPQVEIGFGLRVKATLADTTYPVGIDSQSFLFDPNKPPRISLSYDTGNVIKVGCEDAGDAMGLVVSAFDQDGECQEIRITSREQESLNFGTLNLSFKCNLTQPIFIPVKPHGGLPASPETHANTLYLTAEDDNGRTSTVTAHLKTISNLHPVIELKHEDAPPRVFANTLQSFQIKAWDRDARVHSVDMDWGDGKHTPLSFQETPLDTIRWRFTHRFDSAGSYTVVAKAEDGCNDSDSAPLTFTVYNNNPPTVKARANGVVPATKEFQLNVMANDEDLGAGLDTLDVHIAWGDDRTDTLQGKGYTPINANPRHAYEPSSAMESFLIQVTAIDRLGNTATDTLRITRSMAGLPP